MCHTGSPLIHIMLAEYSANSEGFCTSRTDVASDFYLHLRYNRGLEPMYTQNT